MLVSFIIPAHNEESTIGALIGTIQQYVSLPFEILVIDNGSSDRTAKIASALGVQLIQLEHKTSPSIVRNAGAKQARGDLLVFLDGDTRVTPEWAQTLQANAQGMIDQPMILTGARVVTPDPQECSWIEKYWFAPMAQEPANYINGANIITTPQAFAAIGGMNETLATGEDYDFSQRAKASGVRLVPEARYRLIHDGYPKTIADFYRRERWHGKGDASDFRTILRSKVALLSLAFILTTSLCIVSLIFFSGKATLAWLALTLAMPAACALARFRNNGSRTLFAAFALYSIYLAARGVTTITQPFKEST
ncbi:Glycosyl transferase, family 2 [gamma proteobacterium HdN1]|nr:Glycosyl transferase, family 2 [gamma proteobacterium HdN1]